MIHEVKPLRVIFTRFLLCFVLHPFFSLFLGLDQCKSYGKVDPVLDCVLIQRSDMEKRDCDWDEVLL